MTDEEKGKLATRSIMCTIYAVDMYTLQRWIKLGIPHKREGGETYFQPAEAGQWIKNYYTSGQITHEQIAAIFNVEPRTITQWTNSFGMPKFAPGVYVIKDCVQWRIKFLEKKIKELQQGGADGVSANTKLKIAQAKRQELRLAHEQGMVINRNEIVPIFREAVENTVTKGKQFGRSVAPRVHGLEIKILAEKLQEEFDDTISQFANVPDTLQRFVENDHARHSEHIVVVSEERKDNGKPVRRKKHHARPRKRRSAR